MRLNLASTNQAVTLGQELARGGEGAIYSVVEHPDSVAKVYLQEVEARKIAKLEAMVRNCPPALLRVAAWPTGILRNNRGVRGFLMPKIAARRDVHELYGVKSRGTSFPEANFRFVAHVSANVARAFAAVHSQRHVVGDINHGNLLVGTDGRVVLIDCDSFQVTEGSTVFTCDVGVPLFTAPELQGRILRGLPRTEHHDRFGLAVLLFHLLYLGRHPFAGRFTGKGDMPIETAIAQNRFAYGPDRSQRQMDQPPGTVALEAMGPAVATLFTRAFAPGGQNARPSATEWTAALDSLRTALQPCRASPAHQFPAGLSQCPWCELESRVALRVWPQPIQAGAAGVVDIEQLWRAIAAVPAPPPDPVLPSQCAWTAPPGTPRPAGTVKALRYGLALFLIVCGLASCGAAGKGGGGIFGALVCYVLAGVVWPRVPAAAAAAARTALAQAQGEWNQLLAKWQGEATTQRFAEKKRELEYARAQIAGLAAERQHRMGQLLGAIEPKQRYRYLDRFNLDRADISGIGPSRIATLASFGIETAADIDAKRISQIPGFGPALTERLLSWKHGHARNFQFNSAEGVHPADMAALDQDLAARRAAHLRILQSGSVQLTHLCREIVAARVRLAPFLLAAWDKVKIAEAAQRAL